ncbi:MAG: ribosome-associated translation inhibitor RaiA [Pirellulaceae bacterium]
MQNSISVRHGDLSAATQAKINEKTAKLTRYFDRVTGILVTVNLEHRESPEVEITVSAEHAPDFVATDTSTNVLAALDGAMHKIESQLRKHKDKQTGHRQMPHKHIEVPVEPDTET